jgi:hypothetical protein
MLHLSSSSCSKFVVLSLHVPPNCTLADVSTERAMNMECFPLSKRKLTIYNYIEMSIVYYTSRVQPMLQRKKPVTVITEKV